MKIKVNNIEFVSFSDGICDIYTEDEEGNKIYRYRNLGYSDRILGFKRAYTAKSVQSKANAVIRIPKLPGIDNHDTLEIRDKGRYEIEMIQVFNETNPPSIDLTLSQLEVYR